MINAHCHLDPARLAAARKDGVTGWVASPGVSPDPDFTAKREEGVWWTAGIHPWAACEVAPEEALAALADRLDRVVAVGELGLDHKVARSPSERAVQLQLLRAQLSLARARDLPVVLHVVRSHGAVLDVLKNDGLPRRGGLVHGFSGAPEVASAYLGLGLHLGLGALSLNPRAQRLRASLPKLPESRIVVETDDSTLPLSAIVAAVAAARHEPASKTARYTTANAEALFGLSRDSGSGHDRAP